MDNVFQRGFNLIIPKDADGNPIQVIPTSIMNGSSAGDISQVNKDRASELFPIVDGQTVKLPANPRSKDGSVEYDIVAGTPAGSIEPGNIDPEDFLSWHSAHQLEYIERYGTDVGGGRSITLSGAGGERLDVIRSANGQEVFFLQQMTKSDLAVLSKADQAILQAVLIGFSPADRARIETVMGARSASSMISVNGADLTVGVAVDVKIQAAIDGLDDLFPLDVPLAILVREYDMKISSVMSDIARLNAENDRLRGEINNLSEDVPSEAAQIAILKSEIEANNRIKDTVPVTIEIEEIRVGNTKIDKITITQNGLENMVSELERQRDATQLNLAAQYPELLQDADDVRQIYKDLFENMKTRADGAAFLSVAEVDAQIAAINARANRTSAFFTSTTQIVPDPNAPASAIGGLVNSQDLNQTIKRGFENFVAQEERIRDLDNQKLMLAQTGSLAGSRSLDAPSLIALMQLYYNLEKEAEVAAEAEEVQQQNALLKDYATMQRLVNDVLKAFPSGEDANTQLRNITTHGAGNPGADTLQGEMKFATVMFEAGYKDRQKHPIESLRNITRPTHDLISNEDHPPPANVLINYNQNTWNIFGTQLADAVTLINQQSQIKTNEISSLNRERNRHFDLANNALRRLNESLVTISRG